MTEEARTGGVVWVVGVGAKEGLGAAVARRFAREGLTAVITSRTADRLEAVAADIRGQGGAAHALPGDVSQEADMAAIAAKIADIGPLTVAVFNAADRPTAPSLELSAAAFERTWRIGTLGGFLFGREAIRAMLPRERGTLLFTGATASVRGRPPFAAFAAAKAGLRSVAQTLAREFGPKGLHVAHVVIDGAIDGERIRTAAPAWAAERGPDGLLGIGAIADVYWHLHAQPRSAWTHELDLRPYNETF